MKCEYCENEIPGSTANFCPFCGAKVEMPPAVDNGESVSLKEDREITELGKMRCPGCRHVISIEEFKYGKACTFCGTEFGSASNLPSSAQRDVVPSSTDDGQTLMIRSFIRQSRQQGWFKSVDVSEYGFVPNSGETVYEVVSNVMLNETRSIRRSHTAKSGSSSYDYEGQSESKTYYEFQEVTRGHLFLTSKRIVFTGGQQVRNILFTDIVSFESDWQADEGALQISSSKRTKAMRFTGASVFLFTTLYQALRNERFRALLESGPEDELVEKFKEVGLFKPEPKPQPQPKPKPAQETPQNDGDGCAIGCFVLFIFGVILALVIIYQIYQMGTSN